MPRRAIDNSPEARAKRAEDSRWYYRNDPAYRERKIAAVKRYQAAKRAAKQDDA